LVHIGLLHIGKRALGVFAVATAIGGAALGVAVTGGTAHAQTTSALSLVSATDTVTTNSDGNQTAEPTTLTFSVTCPTGYDETVDATLTQGSTVTADQSFSDKTSVCTGNPQTVTITTESGTAVTAPGQALVGATLTLTALEDSELQPPVGLAQITTISLS
jgi:hypothetical protein